MERRDKDVQEQIAAVVAAASEAAQRLGVAFAEVAQQLVEAVETFQQATTVASDGRYERFQDSPVILQ